MIEIVAATRLPESDFWSKSPLGWSLRRLGFDARLVPHVAFSNRHGLPHIFNARISEANDHDLLVFVHDDVWIDDYFVADRVTEGLEKYDVIGVAGNRRRLPHQPAWFVNLVDNEMVWDDRRNLSGSVAHGSQPSGQVTYYGPVPAECELLDGVFLAAKKSVLQKNHLRFDPRFDFHFYDMDFCRSARQCGLHLGTWPICLTHRSGGTFGSKEWTESYRRYAEKWEL